MTATAVELFRRTAGVGARIALVRPPVVVMPNSLSTLGPVPPIGVAYVAAALREVGHTVQVIDAAGEGMDHPVDIDTPVGMLRRVGISPEEAVARIGPGTQIIGIAQMFLHEWPIAREIAELARVAFPDALIVSGGENATAFHTWMFEQTDAIDAVVLGEGELTITELANRVAEGLPFDDIETIVLRPGLTRPERPASHLPTRMRKLDAIPRPAWDLFPLHKYWAEGNFLGVDRGRSMPILATRGCPYKCSFCSAPQMWTTRYNVREPEELVDEIARLVEDYGIRNIDFCDLTPITKRKWTLAFCDELDRRGISVTWQLPIGTRSESLDEEVLRRLHDTGCRNITYAPESGSPRMLELWDKKLDLPHLVESMRTAKQVGLVVHMNTIIGHPKETWKDLLLTWRLFIKAAVAGADTASPIMFCPYPGSADFAELIEAGTLVPDEAFLYVGLSRGSAAHKSFNPRMSTRQLRTVQLSMLLTFYVLGVVLHPGRLVHYVRAQIDPARESTIFDMLIRSKRRGPMKARWRSVKQGRTQPPSAATAPVDRAA